MHSKFCILNSTQFDSCNDFSKNETFILNFLIFFKAFKSGPSYHHNSENGHEQSLILYLY